jgi:hypothetical protein
VISESVAGDAITSCGLFKGVETLQVVSNG